MEVDPLIEYPKLILHESISEMIVCIVIHSVRIFILILTNYFKIEWGYFMLWQEYHSDIHWKSEHSRKNTFAQTCQYQKSSCIHQHLDNKLNIENTLTIVYLLWITF